MYGYFYSGVLLLLYSRFSKEYLETLERHKGKGIRMWCPLKTKQKTVIPNKM